MGLKFTRSLIKLSDLSRDIFTCAIPTAWRRGFRAKKFLGFLTFLAKILAVFLGKLRKIFQDRGKKYEKIFGLLGKKTKNIQDLGKRNKKNSGYLV